MKDDCHLTPSAVAPLRFRQECVSAGITADRPGRISEYDTSHMECLLHADIVDNIASRLGRQRDLNVTVVEASRELGSRHRFGICVIEAETEVARMGFRLLSDLERNEHGCSCGEWLLGKSHAAGCRYLRVCDGPRIVFYWRTFLDGTILGVDLTDDEDLFCLHSASARGKFGASRTIRKFLDQVKIEVQLAKAALTMWKRSG